MPCLFSKLASFFKNSGLVKALVLSLFLFITGCNSFTGPDEHPEYFNPIFKIASESQNQRMGKTLVLLDSAYNAFPNPGVGDLYSVDSIKYLFFYYQNRDFIKALAYADTMMSIAAKRLDEDKYAEGYAVALFYKGDCFRSMKKYGEAVQFYTIAREATFKYVKNRCELAGNSMGSAAFLMFEQEKYLMAADYFLKQHQDFLYECKLSTLRHLWRLQGSLNDAALSYLKAGLYDSAVYYQDSALNTIRREENKFPTDYLEIGYAKGIIYRDRGDVFLVKGKLPEAEEMYKKSIAAVSGFGTDKPYIQSTQAKLAALYFKKGQTDSAGVVLKELKASLDTVQTEQHLIEWYRLKVKYFVQHSDTDSAFRYQLKYDSLRDFADSRNQKLMTTDLDQETENLQLKYSNDILQKESKLKNRYLLISGIIFLIAAIVAVLVFWNNLRIAKKLNLQVQHKNDDLQKAFSSLEQSHAENSGIMKIVAHDLKNPISAVKNLTYSILKKEPVGPQKNALEIIHDSCVNSLALINDLLYEKKSLSQIRKDMVDMKKMLEQCVDLLQAKANEKNQTLKLETEPAFAFVNSEKIWRVVSNILNNAIKFSYNNTDINVRLEKKDSYVLLSVRDNGIGIPAAIADKIFSISTEGGRSGTSGEKSYGLGLSISQKIIAEHEGKIWFESEEGKGTVFYVKLPVAN